MKDAQVTELLYQALETEICGQSIYLAAIECAVEDDLRASGRNISKRRPNTNESFARPLKPWGWIRRRTLLDAEWFDTRQKA